jgi:hypothetical protein
MGKLMVDIMSGEVQDTISPTKKNPERSRGRAGGVKGGRARAQVLNPDERRRIAKDAANVRWVKKRS